MRRTTSSLIVLLLMPTVCVAQREENVAVDLSGNWEGPTSFLATYEGQSGATLRFKRGDRLELVTRDPYQEMYLLDDSVAFTAGSEAVKLGFVCGAPTRAHPRSAESSSYRLRPSTKDKVDREVAALLTAWVRPGR